MEAAYLKRLQATGNEEYFGAAEQEASSQFSKYIDPFIKDLTDKVILDICCGHGRMTAQILNRFPTVHAFLVDINIDNVNFCKERFANSNVFCTKNNGTDLSELKDHSIDFAFSWDAMVHFNGDLIQLYIKEIIRVLKEGGRALIHFSNFGGDDCGSEVTGPGIRGAMTNNQMLLFLRKYKIIYNEVIDWGGVNNLDAIIVFEK